MEMFNCFICITTMPKAFRDQHHRIPQAAGGTDKDLVDLCNGCHQTIHRIGYAMMNTKRQHEVEGMLLYFKEENGCRDRAAMLAQTVVQEMLAKGDGFKPETEELPKLLTLELDATTHKRLLFAARDRKQSMANYTIIAIRKQLDRDL